MILWKSLKRTEEGIEDIHNTGYQYEQEILGRKLLIYSITFHKEHGKGNTANSK